MSKAASTSLAVFMMVTCLWSRAATLRGTVSDQTGVPAQNTQVDLYSGEGEWHTTTDAAGGFHFDDLGAGRYDLEATLFGFRKTIVRDIEIGPSSISTKNVVLQIVGSAYECEHNFYRAEYVEGTTNPSIEGIVNPSPDRRFGTLAGATVTLHKIGSNEVPTLAHTDANGKFRVTDLEPGLYDLKAERKGYTDFSESEVRVRRGHALKVEFSMIPIGTVALCE